MHMPSFVPEILATASGPFFIAQFLRDTHLLSALHPYSDTLSVHSMDISLIPLYLYKIPRNCSNVLLTSNIMYTMQKIHETIEIDDKNVQKTEANLENDENLGFSPAKSSKLDGKSTVNAIGVIGCSSAVLKIGEDSVSDSSTSVF